MRLANLSRARASLALAAMGLLFTGSASAQVFTWTGGGSSGVDNVIDPANWDANGVPAFTPTLFGSTGSFAFSAAAPVKVLDFGGREVEGRAGTHGGGYTFQNMGPNGFLFRNGQNQTFSGLTTLAGNASFTQNNTWNLAVAASATLHVTGNATHFQGGGTRAIQFTGAGTVLIDGIATATAGLNNIGGGSVTLGQATTGNTSGSIRVSGGGLTRIQGSITGSGGGAQLREATNGTLLLNGNVTVPTTQYNINGSSGLVTGVLGGVGTIHSSPVNVGTTNPGHLSPGDPAVAGGIGTFSISGGVVTLGASGSLVMQIDSPAAHDRLALVGSTSMSIHPSAQLDLSVAANAVGDFDLITHSAAALNGTFANVTVNGGSLPTGWALNYETTRVVLSIPIPEPGTLALLGAAGMAMLRRR